MKKPPPAVDRIDAIKRGFQEIRSGLVRAYAGLDGGSFREDPWTWREGGGGLTAVLEDGRVFERACVGFSHVLGSSLPPAATSRHPELAGRPFEVLGVSSIAHPRNPHAPTAHMNVRFFRAHGPAGETWWFGGGMDMTPYYGYEEDARHFHRTCRDALAPFGPELYPRFKKQCDEYFYLRHRREPRGVGGVFFDDLNEPSFEACFALARGVGGAYVPAYIPVVERRAKTPYGERERDFQEIRRGRYAEFNLAQDRGTAFGLHIGGRAESILASLPPAVKWKYDWKPEPGSPEESLLTRFLVPREWA